MNQINQTEQNDQSTEQNYTTEVLNDGEKIARIYTIGQQEVALVCSRPFSGLNTLQITIVIDGKPYTRISNKSKEEIGYKDLLTEEFITLGRFEINNSIIILHLKPEDNTKLSSLNPSLAA